MSNNARSKEKLRHGDVGEEGGGRVVCVCGSSKDNWVNYRILGEEDCV